MSYRKIMFTKSSAQRTSICGFVCPSSSSCSRPSSSISSHSNPREVTCNMLTSAILLLSSVASASSFVGKGREGGGSGRSSSSSLLSFANGDDVLAFNQLQHSGQCCQLYMSILKYLIFLIKYYSCRRKKLVMEKNRLFLATLIQVTR